MNAYESMLPQEATPSYFIYLEVDPHSVDVNISPTKTEVKFADDSIIFQTLYACVKESLGRNSFGAIIDFDSQNMVEIPAFSNKFDEYRPDVSAPQVSLDEQYNPFAMSGETQHGIGSGSFGDLGNFGDSGHFSGGAQHDGSSQFGGFSQSQPGGGQYSKYIDKRDDYGKLFEDKVASQPVQIVVQKKYIVTSSKSGLLVINIRRAQERIFYERFLKALKGGEHVSQSALFPVQVNVGADNRLIFDEHAEMLKSLGFDISPFGVDTIVVNGMPEGFQVDQSSVESAMADVLIALTENHTGLAEMIESSMAEKFARLAASECKPVESPVEARSLTDTLFACSNSEYTSSGHKIMSILSVDSLDKIF